MDLSIKAYNLEFESRAIDMSARFVHPTYRSEYIAESPEMVTLVKLPRRLCSKKSWSE